MQKVQIQGADVITQKIADLHILATNRVDVEFDVSDSVYQFLILLVQINSQNEKTKHQVLYQNNVPVKPYNVRVAPELRIGHTVIATAVDAEGQAWFDANCGYYEQLKVNDTSSLFIGVSKVEETETYDPTPSFADVATGVGAKYGFFDDDLRSVITDTGQFVGFMNDGEIQAAFDSYQINMNTSQSIVRTKPRQK